jgi:hypothetical protein
MKLCKDCRWCELKDQGLSKCLNPKNFRETDLVYGTIGQVARSQYCAAQRAYDGPCDDYCSINGNWFESKKMKDKKHYNYNDVAEYLEANGQKEAADRLRAEFSSKERFGFWRRIITSSFLMFGGIITHMKGK